MDNTRLDRYLDRLGARWSGASARMEMLATPRSQRRLWWVLCTVAVLWILLALADLTWSLFPRPAPQSPPGDIINPVAASTASARPRAVDIEQLANRPLFGAVDAPVPDSIVEDEAPAASTASTLGSIGETATETELPLLLVGLVYSPDTSLARAMIEYQQTQDQYIVGDELPVAGKVSVAGIMADRVILDNQGEYELLLLFDETPGIASRASSEAAAEEQAAADLQKALRERNSDIRRSAEAHRRGVGPAPTSLSKVVNIGPVKEAGELVGYRLSAARAAAQYEALGFREDDIVTEINGIPVTGPGGAQELFRAMRSSGEVRFGVLREGRQVTLTVGVGKDLGG